MTHILFPKMKKHGAKLGSRKSSVVARTAILNFLAAAPDEDLGPLLAVLLDPLSRVFKRCEAGDAVGGLAIEGHLDGAKEGLTLEKNGIVPMPWWADAHQDLSAHSWIQCIDREELSAIQFEVKMSLLMLLDDVVARLGHKLEPFLPRLIALLTQMLEEACEPILKVDNMEVEDREVIQHDAVDQASDGQSTGGCGDQDKMVKEEGEEEAEEVNGAQSRVSKVNEKVEEGVTARGSEPRPVAWKQIRRRCLKLLTAFWSNFPDHVDHDLFVGRFLLAVEPMMGRLSVECSSQK